MGYPILCLIKIVVNFFSPFVTIVLNLVFVKFMIIMIFQILNSIETWDYLMFVSFLDIICLNFLKFFFFLAVTNFTTSKKVV